jgi:hypothetical protein
VWHIAGQGEWTAESEGNLAEELHSVEQVRRSVEYCVRDWCQCCEHQYTTELSKL